MPLRFSLLCLPHGRGAHVVDYVLSSQDLLPFIRHLGKPHPLSRPCSSLFLPLGFPPCSTPPPPGPPRTTILFDEGDLYTYLGL